MAAVTCHAGGIGDFFEPGEMGVILDSPEATQIADAIQHFADNRSRLAQIALFNHEYASRRFLASHAAAFLKDRYLELVNRSSADRGS